MIAQWVLLCYKPSTRNIWVYQILIEWCLNKDTYTFHILNCVFVCFEGWRIGKKFYTLQSPTIGPQMPCMKPHASSLRGMVIVRVRRKIRLKVRVWRRLWMRQLTTPTLPSFSNPDPSAFLWGIQRFCRGSSTWCCYLLYERICERIKSWTTICTGLSKSASLSQRPSTRYIN